MRPLSSLVRMETRLQRIAFQHIHTTLDTKVFDAAKSAYVPDPTRISDFTYRQIVNAAYAMLDAERGKLQLQGGVRVERATTQFHLNTNERHIRQSIQQRLSERARCVQRRRLASGKAELLDPHSPARRHRRA